jgi:hypothetical protein
MVMAANSNDFTLTSCFVMRIVLLALIIGGTAGVLYLSGFLAGLPLPGTSRMASIADSGYTASLVNGLIPAVSRRFFTVLSFNPSFSAISEAVNPFTYLLSVNIVKKLLNICLHKIYKYFRFLAIFLLT